MPMPKHKEFVHLKSRALKYSTYPMVPFPGIGGLGGFCVGGVVRGRPPIFML